jgi:hypothetical protein
LPPLRILRGPERIGWLYHRVARRFVGVTYRLARVNGELGAVALMDGHIFSVLSFVVDGEHISRIYNIRNPDKLTRIALRDLDSRPPAVVTDHSASSSCQ